MCIYKKALISCSLTWSPCQYTTPIHSHFWRLGDVGTVRKDIHTEIGTQYTTPIHSQFLETWGRGDSTYVYIYGYRDIIYHLYTVSFLETWGRGDSTYKYAYGDRDIIHHPYTLSILETWGRGDVTYEYTYGDKDTIYHHYILSFSGYQDIHTGTETWGVYIQIYMYIFIYI